MAAGIVRIVGRLDDEKREIHAALRRSYAENSAWFGGSFFLVLILILILFDYDYDYDYD